MGLWFLGFSVHSCLALWQSAPYIIIMADSDTKLMTQWWWWCKDRRKDTKPLAWLWRSASAFQTSPHVSTLNFQHIALCKSHCDLTTYSTASFLDGLGWIPWMSSISRRRSLFPYPAPCSAFRLYGEIVRVDMCWIFSRNISLHICTI